MIKTLKRILSICGKHKKRVYIGVASSLLNAICNSMSILAILIILINIEMLTPNIIILTASILLGSLIGKCVLKYLMNCFLSATGYIVFCDQRLSLGDKLKKAPLGYFSDKNLGNITNAVTTSMLELESFSMMAVENIIGGIIQASILSVFLFRFDLYIGLLSLVGLSAAMCAISMIQKRSAQLAPTRNKTVEKTTTAVLEFIHGISVVKSFGKIKNGNNIHDVFKENADAFTALEKGVISFSGLFLGILEVFSGLILMLSAYLMLDGEISFAVGVMFLVSSFMIYGQLSAVGNGAFLLQLIGDALDRLEETCDVPIMESGNTELPTKNFDIEFCNVRFSYDCQEVLRNLSFKAPTQSSLAIVGYSGSGKTTICNLIVRFWDVSSGEILLGGKNIKEYNPDELMDCFSMVFQNVYLFNDTIENNIKFGKPDATHEEVMEVSKKACCHDFIEELPHGYNTILGEGGSNISGGEKQRISIARAILKDAPVVILDEATSSVDPENEYELIQAINELTKGKTLISIAHKMSTVKNADLIIVIDSGEIVQQGNHVQLEKEEGVYKQFLDVRLNSAGWVLSS